MKRKGRSVRAFGQIFHIGKLRVIWQSGEHQIRCNWRDHCWHLDPVLSYRCVTFGRLLVEWETSPFYLGRRSGGG